MASITPTKPSKYIDTSDTGTASNTVKGHDSARKLFDAYLVEEELLYADISNSNCREVLGKFGDFLIKTEKADGNFFKGGTLIQYLGRVKLKLYNAHKEWAIWRDHDADKSSWYNKVKVALNRGSFKRWIEGIVDRKVRTHIIVLNWSQLYMIMSIE